MPGYAIMLPHLSFDVRPEGFNAVNVVMASDKLLAVIDAMMFVAGKDQTIVTAPFVSIDIAL